MSAITFGRGVPAFGRAAVEGFGKKGGDGGDQQGDAGARAAERMAACSTPPAPFSKLPTTSGTKPPPKFAAG